MARILIADMPSGAVTLLRILEGHECTVVHTMREAETKLVAEAFDLIVAALHFDDSQMFELMREVKKSPTNANKPIICFCSRDTPMSRLIHESLECSTKALGAWMYLAEHSYNVYQDPDAELRRIIDRCLTEESRKDIQQRRIDIQIKRTELQELRMLLQSQEWSPELKIHLASLQSELELLLAEVTRLHSASDLERTSIVTSRDLKDRVSENVRLTENEMASTEESQSAVETGQSAGEDKLSAKEGIQDVAGLRKQRITAENLKANTN